MGYAGTDTCRVCGAHLIQIQEIQVETVCNMEVGRDRLFALFPGINQLVVLTAHAGKEEVDIVCRHSDHLQSISSQSKTGLVDCCSSSRPIFMCYFLGGGTLAPQNLQETVSCLLAEGTI